MSGSVTIMPAGSDLFASGARSLVDPVNTVGTSGKGLALAFKKRFPDAVRLYEQDAKMGSLRIGAPWCAWSTALCRVPATLIYFFPTKKHWRDPSHIEWIRAGLWGFEPRGIGLIDRVIANVASGVDSIAIPGLGCGLGGLAWDDVRPLLEKAGKQMASAGVHVRIYAPHEDR